MGINRKQRRATQARESRVFKQMRLRPEAEKLGEAILAQRRDLRQLHDKLEARLEHGESLASAARGLPELSTVATPDYQRTARHLLQRHAQMHTRLGDALRKHNCPDDAAQCYRNALRLCPDDSEAFERLVSVQRQSGKLGQTMPSFEEAVGFDPDDPAVKHLRASMLGDGQPERASDSYIRTLFDGYAGRFDEHLAELGYRAPQVVAAQLASNLPSGQEFDAVLDAGCGTGLCGPRLRYLARKLVGVDLSPSMLIKADQRHCYDELFESELLAFLDQKAETWDAIVASDVLVYFGDLRPFLRSATQTLRDGGRLIFTLEEKPGHGASYGLQTNGRYRHRAAHVRQLLTEHGFGIDRISSDSFRTEAGQPVPCLLVSAQKRDGLRHSVQQ